MPARIPAVAEQPALSIPDAGRPLGLNREAAYRAAKDGHLPTVQISERRWVVPTASLRTMLGLPIDGPALELPTGGDL